MMAGLIFVFSLAALTQFFVSYCRSLIAASARRSLSADVQDVVGFTKAGRSEDFARIMQYLRMCPERREDRGGIQAIGAYFRMLGLARQTLGSILPSLRAWTEAERAKCSYFVAVALDQRIAYNRDMLAEQMTT